MYKCAIPLPADSYSRPVLAILQQGLRGKNVGLKPTAQPGTWHSADMYCLMIWPGAKPPDPLRLSGKQLLHDAQCRRAWPETLNDFDRVEIFVSALYVVLRSARFPSRGACIYQVSVDAVPMLKKDEGPVDLFRVNHARSLSFGMGKTTSLWPDARAPGQSTVESILFFYAVIWDRCPIQRPGIG